MNPRLDFYLTAEEQQQLRDTAAVLPLQLGAFAARAFKNYSPRRPVPGVPVDAKKLPLTVDASTVGQLRRMTCGKNDAEHFRAAILQELKRLTPGAS